MFTIKFYSSDGYRSVIRQADSFTVLHGGDGGAEITLHQKNPADDCRIDIEGYEPVGRADGWPDVYAKAIIENESGKTTEIISAKTYRGPPRPQTNPLSNPTGL